MTQRRVVVVGGGAAGEAFAGALRRLDRGIEIALVERRLIGGECTYWACMPTKTLLRSPELAAAAGLAPGAPPGEPLEPTSIFGWRDSVVESLDDEGHVEWLRDRDVEPVRGTAAVLEPGLLDVDGAEMRYDDLVVATGSDPAVPAVEGLAETGYWTNRDATTASEVPRSVAILGAGAVGCELAQFYARLGARVVVVDPNDRPLVREYPGAGRLLQEHLEAEGVEFRFGRRAGRAEPGVRLTLDDGSAVEGERVLVATGRRPNAGGMGLERLGLEIGPEGIVVDERLRAAEGVWAIGDVTGISLFTHVGKYQGRVAAANVAGLEARADYRAVPRVLFTDPQVASVGTTRDGAGIVTSVWEVNRTARSSTYERPKRKGFLKVFADERRGVLVGAAAVGPEAGEWIGQLTLAVRAEVAVDILRDVIQPFPTFSEAVHFAVRDLPL
jgi:pyruvate/2-oxoglutarate dehydrogenase complex dihydrolipoamide dehydrogenase (E3) component